MKNQWGWGSLRGWVLWLGAAVCHGVPEGMSVVWRMQCAVESLREQMLWLGGAGCQEVPSGMGAVAGGCNVPWGP